MCEQQRWTFYRLSLQIEECPIWGLKKKKKARSLFLAEAKSFAKNEEFCGFDLRITVGPLTVAALTIKITNFVVEDKTKFACAYLQPAR
jgi:hypothetical protein